VTGAVPIRRNTKDPVYLITLKAYVAEMLRSQDFFFYPEGGRSYSGELKNPKTGLMHAVLQGRHANVSIVPTAVAYDLVLEDHVLARQGTKRVQRAFSRELAELVRYAVATDNASSRSASPFRSRASTPGRGAPCWTLRTR
jgi:1-acyl-sn-glycerol-3-phosphate acyltransferase